MKSKKITFRVTADEHERLAVKAIEATAKAQKRVTITDLIRKTIARLLGE